LALSLASYLHHYFTNPPDHHMTVCRFVIVQ